jgi:Icc protein
MVAAEHNKTNRTMEAPLRVLQITDTHLFGDENGRLAGMDTDASSLEVIERVLGEFLPVDLILATGDIAHHGFEQAYRRFKQRFEQLGAPTLVIPGNHDQPRLLKQIMQGGRVQARDHFLLGNWSFIMLDSTVSGTNGGHLSAHELELLERRLREHPDRHAMVCLHHHPVSMQCDWIDSIGVDNGDEFFALIDRFPQVRSVVWGHVHQEFSSERNGVRLFASPSTCIQFKPRQRDFALDDVPPGFRWFELYPDGRIETAVERIAVGSRGVDLGTNGYG